MFRKCEQKNVPASVLDGGRGLKGLYECWSEWKAQEIVVCALWEGLVDTVCQSNGGVGGGGALA